MDVSDSCFFVGARWDGMEGVDIGWGERDGGRDELS